MPIIAIENLGSMGIIQDMPPHELPPAAWSDGKNVRFVDGKVQKVKGEIDVWGAPGTTPHWIMPWSTTSENLWVYTGVAKAYTVNSSGSHVDVTRYTTTPGDDDYTAGVRPLWSGGVLHGVPILNHNGTDYPQQWDNNNNRFKDLDNWPVDVYAKIIRPYKNFLIALHVTKLSTDYPYVVKWSHPADPGTVPTSWDESDASTLAGEQTISQSGGFLVDCLPLAGQNILYKDDAIWSMQLAGSQYVFSFNELSSTIGALAPRCIKEFYRQHFIVGKNDIVLFDGVTPRSIVNNRVRRWFFGQLHSTYWDKTVVTVNYPYREVWISFVEQGATSEYLTRALIWNWDTDTWTTRDLPDISHIGYGQVDDTVSETFDTSSGTFDSDFGGYGSPNVSPASLQLLFSKAYGTAALIHGDEGYDNNGTAYMSFIERTGLAIAGKDMQGQPKVDPASIKFIRAVFPKISAPILITLQVYIGMQDTVEGAVRWEGPYDFVVGQDTKIDCSMSGRYLALKFVDEGVVPWEFTGYSLDMDIISEF